MTTEAYTPTTSKRLWIIFWLAEAALILNSAFELTGDIPPLSVLAGFSLGTAAVSFFIFGMMALLAGGVARIRKAYPYLVGLVVVSSLIRLAVLIFQM